MELDQVDVHVVISLHHVLSVRTVLGEPLQQHQRLDGEVGVGVDEVLLYDVPVLLGLVADLQLDGVVLLLLPPEQEHHAHAAEAGGVPGPGLPDGGPGREVGHRAADHHQEAGRGGGVVLTHPGAEEGGAGGGEDEVRGIARLTGGPNLDLGC